MKARMIYDEVWRDEAFFALSDQAKLLYFYLHTNTRLSLIRAYKLPDREMINDLMVTPKRLQELKEEVGLLGIYFVEGYVILGNRHSVFKYKGPKLGIPIKEQEERLPNRVFTEYISKTDTLSIPLSYPYDTSSDSSSSSESDHISEGDSLS